MRDGMPVLATLLVLAATVAPVLSSDTVAPATQDVDAQIAEDSAATPGQPAKLVVELDAAPSGPARPEHTSPIDPGEPCDGWH